MTTQPSHELIYARVSDGMLPSLPRMFTSFQQMLVELLQNCARAGAPHVTVIYDPLEKTLEIRDDGPGQTDPQVLFTAGESQWDEAIAQTAQPAGLGLFSVLAFASQAIYESHPADGAGWRVTVTPELLRGAPAILDRLNGGTPSAHGFSIKLFLNGDAQKVDKALVRTARALYPFTLTYQDAEGAEVLPPYRAWEPQLTVETPYGRVDWSTELTMSQSYLQRTEFCREYQARPSSNLREALKEAAQKHCHKKLAEAVVNESLLWFVPDGDEVQVRLPDRSELIDNRNLHLAAKAIADALVSAIVEKAQAVMSSWPERLSGYEVPRVPDVNMPAWLRDDAIRQALLELFRWHRVEYTDYGSTYVYYDEGAVVETDKRCFFDKNALPVASRTLAQTLNQSGVAAYYAPESTNVRVLVKGVQHNAKLSPYVAIAEGISITMGDKPLTTNDKGEPLTIRWLVAGDDDNFDLFGLGKVRTGVVWIGSPNELTQYVGESGNGSGSLLSAILQWDYHGNSDDPHYWEWVECDEHDSDICYEAIAEVVILQVSKAFQPRMARQRETYFKLEGALGAAHTAAHEAHTLVDRLAEIKHPAVSGLRLRAKRFGAFAEALEADLRQARTVQGLKAGIPQPNGGEDPGKKKRKKKAR